MVKNIKVIKKMTLNYSMLRATIKPVIPSVIKLNVAIKSNYAECHGHGTIPCSKLIDVENVSLRKE